MAFTKIIGQNKKVWNAFLQDPEIQDGFKVIIEKFLLPDNIDSALFSMNYEARKFHNEGLSHNHVYRDEVKNEYGIKYEEIDWSPSYTIKFACLGDDVVHLGSLAEVLELYEATDISNPFQIENTPSITLYKDGKSIKNIRFSNALARKHEQMPYELVDLLDLPIYEINIKDEDGNPIQITIIATEQSTTNGDILKTGDSNWSPSPTFKSHYSGLDFALHKPQPFHDWFVFAYPDVTKWVASDSKDFLRKYDEERLTDKKGKASFLLYRLSIDEYKKKYELECAYKSTESGYGIGNALFFILSVLLILALIGIVSWSKVKNFAIFYACFCLAGLILIIGSLIWGKAQKKV